MNMHIFLNQNTAYLQGVYFEVMTGQREGVSVHFKEQSVRDFQLDLR